MADPQQGTMLDGEFCRILAQVPGDDLAIDVSDKWDAMREERDRYAAALRSIRDHGKTHDQPCWAISNGDCADVMQETARSALDD